MVPILAFLSISALFAPKDKDYLVIECDDSYCWVTAPGDTPSDQQIGVIYKVDGQWTLTPGTEPPTSEERKEQQEEAKPEQPKDEQPSDPQADGFACLTFRQGRITVTDCGDDEVVSEPRVVKIGLFEDRN